MGIGAPSEFPIATVMIGIFISAACFAASKGSES